MVDGLSSGDHEAWDRALIAANPASILVAIGCRMGPDLRQRLTPEDVWQETMLRAWQARASLDWQGTPAFRRWLLAIAANCLEDHRDHARAKKRDSGRTVALGSSSTSPGLEPWGSTTPSRIAVEKERATRMEHALLSLDDDVRDVVRLRLFEDMPITEIATALHLGESAVRHRFRRGAESYRETLRALLGATNADGVTRDRSAARQRAAAGENGDGSEPGSR